MEIAEIGKKLLDKTISDIPLYKNATRFTTSEGYYRAFLRGERFYIRITTENECIRVEVCCIERVANELAEKFGEEAYPDPYVHRSVNYIWDKNISLADPKLVTSLRNILSFTNKALKKHPKY